MIKEFVPEMRSDKKDAEIARLRGQVQVLRVGINELLEQMDTVTGWEHARDIEPYHAQELFEHAVNQARAALAATEGK